MLICTYEHTCRGYKEYVALTDKERKAFLDANNRDLYAEGYADAAKASGCEFWMNGKQICT